MHISILALYEFYIIMAHAFAIPMKDCILTIMYQNPDVTYHPFQWKRQCLQGTFDSVFSSFGCPGASSVDCASKRGFVARSFPSTSQVQAIGKGKGSKMNKTPKNMSHGQPTAKLKACDFNHTDGRVSSYALSKCYQDTATSGTSFVNAPALGLLRRPVKSCYNRR